MNFNYYTEKKPDMDAVKLLRLSNHAKQNKKPAGSMLPAGFVIDEVFIFLQFGVDNSKSIWYTRLNS